MVNVMFTVRVGVVAVLTCLVLQQVRCAQRLEVRQVLEHHARQRRGVTSKLFRWKRDSTDVNVENLKKSLSLGEDSGLEVIQTSKTVQGTKLVKLQETYKGEAVWEGVFTVEINSTGHVIDTFGYVYRDLGSDLNITSRVLDRDEALDLCLQNHRHAHLNDNITQVEVDGHVRVNSDNRAIKGFLVMYLIKTEQGLQRPACLINARRPGTVSSTWQALGMCSDCNAKGIGGNIKIGKIRYEDFERCLDVRREGDVCYLENKYVRVINNTFYYIVNAMIEQFMQTVSAPTPGDLALIQRYNTTASYDCLAIHDEFNGGFSPSLDALFYGTVVSRMFEDWYDISLHHWKQFVFRVHYGYLNERAAWTGSEIIFGDGNQTVYPFIALDVVGHEMAHAITEKTSRLLYYNQHGGIDEAFSDMTGQVAEAYFGQQDWLLAADIMKTAPAARFFENPEDDNNSISHADNYTEFMNVHLSSGVYNKAFYILVHDMQLPIRQVYGVFLHANRLYWHHMSNFASAACDVMKAAYDLGQDVSKFYQAFRQVGVDACDVRRHVMKLITGQKYGNITVGRDTHPSFMISLPEYWPEYVTVVANSSKGDVIINVTAESTTLASKLGSVKMDVSDLVANSSEVELTITLSTLSPHLLSDVTLQAAIWCRRNETADGSLRPTDLRIKKYYMCKGMELSFY